MDNIVESLFSSEPASAPDASAPASFSTPAESSQQPAAAEPSLDTWELPPAQDAQQQQAQPPVAPPVDPGVEPPPAVEASVAPALPTGLQAYVETYGAENVSALTDMAFGLMGIGEIPEGRTPQGHFLDQIYQFDTRAYDALVKEVVRSHEGELVKNLRESVLRAEGLPTTPEELAGLRDFARYGHQYVNDEAGRQFLQQIPQELQGAFGRMTEVRRNWMVGQVADGYMPKEVAIEDLQRAENDYQRGLADQEKIRLDDERQSQQVVQRAYQQTEQQLSAQYDQIIEARAKADNIHPEIVRDIYARAAQELERFANAALHNYATNEQERVLGVRAIRGYQALVEANKTGSPFAIKQAMNELRILAEQQYSVHLQARRQRVQQAQPGNGGQQQQQQQQHGQQQQQTRVIEQEQRARNGGMQLPNGQTITDALFG